MGSHTGTRGRDSAFIRERVTELIRASKLSREEIAEGMSQLLGLPVTARQLYNYTANSREEYRFPLQYLRAFCEVVGDWTLFSGLAERAGFVLADRQQQALMQLGKAHADLEAAKKLLAEVSL